MAESAAVDVSVERDAASTRLSVISSTSRDGASPESARHCSTNATNPGSARCRAETLTCTAHPSRPGRGRGAGQLQHLLPQRDAQRAAVRTAQERRGPEQPPLRVRPAHERLPRGDRAAAQVDDRLVVRQQLAALQPFGERGVHGELVGRDRAPRLGVDVDPPGPAALGRVHRAVGLLQERLAASRSRRPSPRRSPRSAPRARAPGTAGPPRPGSARPPAPPRRPSCTCSQRIDELVAADAASSCRPPGSRRPAAPRPGAGGRRRPRARTCR